MADNTYMSLTAQKYYDQKLKTYISDQIAANTHTPDWNASEGEPGHVLNRTHYEGVTTYSFDGDLTDKEYIQVDVGMYFIKVADDVLSKSDLIGKNMVVTINGNDTEEVIAEDRVMDGSEMCMSGYIVNDSTGEIPYIYAINTEFTAGSIVLSPGVYFVQFSNDNFAYYTKTLTLETIKRIDPKFLPEHLPYSEIIQGNPTFDGNLDGRETTQIGDTQYLVKMSDQILSVADLVGATVVQHDIAEDTDEELVLTEEMVMDASSEGIPMILVGDGLVFCMQSDFNLDGLTLTAGVHFMYIVNGGYVKSLSCVDATTEKIHKLDGKYLPDGVPYTETKVLEPTFDGNINGREVYNLGGMGFVKVSDQSLAADDLVNATIVGNLGGEIQELTITSDMIASFYGVVYVQYGDAMLVLYVSPENNTLDMTPGVYFLNVPGEGYAMSLSCLTEPYVKETIHKLDAKYLPVTLPEVTTSDNGKVLQVKSGKWTTEQLSYTNLTDKPTIPSSLPANGGNADTVDNKHAYDFAAAGHKHHYLQTQTTSIKLPTSADWSSITQGNSKFVAIASNSDIAAYSVSYNTNPVWTQTTMPTSANWSSVAYGNSKFVAIASGSDIAAYSSDGITWTQTTMPTSADWSSIIRGNSKFVAIASGSDIAAYSSDGITWTQTTMPTSANWSSIACGYFNGNYNFVAIASGSDIAAYSSDGITWTQTTMPSSYNWSSVAYGNSKFVAIAKSLNMAAYSSDGITWKYAWLPSTKNWGSILYGHDKFVAVAENSTVMIYSSNGIDWTHGTIPVSANWSSVAYGDSKFVAIAKGTDSVAYSKNGAIWLESLTDIQHGNGSSATYVIKNNLFYELPLVAISGSYNDLTDKPKLAGSYNDLTDKPIPDASSASEGAFLRVINGAWAAVTLPNVEDGEF